MANNTQHLAPAPTANTDAADSLSLLLLVATRKGAWIYHGDATRQHWRADGPHFLGHIISHLVLDPRDGCTLLAAAKTGHLGPTIFRSTDIGRSWSEARHPPAFTAAAEGSAGLAGRAVDHTFWLTPANANEPEVWYAGTSPQGLFRSDDGGVSWAPFSCINDDPHTKGSVPKIKHLSKARKRTAAPLSMFHLEASRKRHEALWRLDQGQ